MNPERHGEFEPQPTALERVIFYLDDRYHNADALQRSTSFRIHERPEDYQPARGTFVDYDHHDSLQGLFAERILLGPPDDISDESSTLMRLERLLHPDGEESPQHEQISDNGQEVIARLFGRRMHVYRLVDMETLVALSDMDSRAAFCVRFESDDGDRNKDIYFTVDGERGIEQFEPSKTDVPPHFEALAALQRGIEQGTHDSISSVKDENLEEDTYELFLGLTSSGDIDRQEMATIWESMLSERNLLAFRGKRHFDPFS